MTLSDQLPGTILQRASKVVVIANESEFDPSIRQLSRYTGYLGAAVPRVTRTDMSDRPHPLDPLTERAASLGAPQGAIV